MEENRFCTRCGAAIPEGAAFCPECGSQLGQGASPRPAYNAPSNQGIGFLGILILIYGVLAIIYGVMDMSSSIGLTETSYNELIQTMSDLVGMDMSEYMPIWTDSLPLMMTLSMGFLTISGVLAVASYYVLKKKNDWKIGLILCAASSVACLGMSCFSMYASMGVLLFVIGIVVTVLLYTKKDAFAS